MKLHVQLCRRGTRIVALLRGPAHQIDLNFETVDVACKLLEERERLFEEKRQVIAVELVQSTTCGICDLRI